MSVSRVSASHVYFKAIFIPQHIGRSRIYKHTQAEKQTNSKKPTIMLTMLLPIVEIVHLFRS